MPIEPKELCCKCNNAVRRAGQRYCDECHAAAQRVYRERHPILTKELMEKLGIHVPGAIR